MKKEYKVEITYDGRTETDGTQKLSDILDMIANAEDGSYIEISVKKVEK